MKLAFPCQCGGLLKVYDRRKIGLSFQFRARCDCGNSTKISYPLEDSFMLLRPRRKEVLDIEAQPAMIESVGNEIKQVRGGM